MLAVPSPDPSDSPARAAESTSTKVVSTPMPVPVNVEPEQPVPQISYQTVMVTFICLMLWIYMLYFARVLILPILVAMLLKLVLAPVVKALSRARIPEAAGAALVITVAAAAMAYGAYALSAPATEWITRIPERLYILRMHLSHIREPFEYVGQAVRAISQLSTLGDAGVVQGAAANAAPASSIDQITIGTLVLSETASITVSLGSMLVLLYFLLASGDMFLRKLVTVLPTFSDKKQAVEIAHRVQSDISSYLLTITLINTALGMIVAGALYLYGMPSPWLWGAMVGLFNFVPFLGPAVCVAVVTLASFMSFPLWQTAIVPPLIVTGLCFLEGHLLTPTILARRLVLNPVAVFLALLFCGWLWGIIGVLVSVPLLAVLKIFCDQVRPLTPIGEFLGR